MTAPVPSPAPRKQDSMRRRQTCMDCGRSFTRHSRRGYTTKCPHCGETQPGPTMLAKLATKAAAHHADPVADGRPKVSPSRPRRPRAAVQDAVPESCPPPAAPDRPARRRLVVQTGGAPSATPPLLAPSAATPPPSSPPSAGPPQRRSFLDVLLEGWGAA